MITRQNILVSKGCLDLLFVVDFCAVVFSCLSSHVADVDSADCERLNVLLLSLVDAVLEVTFLRRKSAAEVAVAVAVGASPVSSSGVAEGFERLTVAAVVVAGVASTVAAAPGLPGVSSPRITSAMVPPDTSADPCCAFLRRSCS